MKERILKLSTPKKLALAAAILGIAAFIIGNPTGSNLIKINAKELALSTIKNQDKIDPLTLADWLIKEKADFMIIDLRNGKDFSEYNIPTSVNVGMEDLLSSDIMRNQKILLLGDDDVASAQGWFLMKSSGYLSVYILKGGMNGWKDEILFPKLAGDASSRQLDEFEKIKQISLHFGGTPQLVGIEQTTPYSAPSVKPASPVMPKLSPAAASGKSVKKKKEGC